MMLAAKALAIGRVKPRAAVLDLNDVVGEHAPLLASAARPLASPAVAIEYLQGVKAI